MPVCYIGVGSNLGNRKNNIKLATYFTLSVGDAVKKYRNKFLKGLSKIEGTGDEKEAGKTWNIIKKCEQWPELQDIIFPEINHFLAADKNPTGVMARMSALGFVAVADEKLPKKRKK